MPRLMNIALWSGSGALAGATLTYAAGRAGEVAAQVRALPGRLRQLAPMRPGFMRGRQSVRREACAGGRLGPARGAPMRETGNFAFDEYRAAAIARLEAEADQFRAFLDGLRRARDKAEFDQFIADRKGPVTTS